MTEGTTSTKAPEKIPPGKSQMPPLRIAALLIIVLGLGTAGFLALRQPSGRAHVRRHDSAEPLPYVNYRPIPSEERGKIGTTVLDKARAYRGYTLYVPKGEAAAYLVDLDGEIVHRWASEEGQADQATPLPGDWRGFYCVRMTPEGDLIATINRRYLLKLDWNSKVVFKAPISAHHDVIVGDDGMIYATIAEPRLVEIAGKQRAIEGDAVAVLTPDGALKKKYSLYELFESDPTLKSLMEERAARGFKRLDAKGIDTVLDDDTDDDEDVGFSARVLKAPGVRDRAKTLFATGKLPNGNDFESLVFMRAMRGHPSDVFHLNSVVPLKAHPAGLWKDGAIMVSMRNVDSLFVFDPSDNNKVVWTWGPNEVFGQHQPSIVHGGNVLIYDNGRSWRPGGNHKSSRVIELDPKTKKIVWQWEADPPTSFYSPAEGGAQMLPNNNVLIVEEKGRILEVTPDKKVVWEYWDPKRDPSGRRRAGFYRAERYAPEVVEPLLQKHKQAAP